MLRDARMRLTLLVIVLVVGGGYSKSIKKVTQDDAVPTKGAPATKLTKSKPAKLTKSPPPILAIEIVDANDSNTKSKNSKRTIDSSLGYGHQQNYFGVTSKPKFQIYKYSQHDIPPFRGADTYSQQNQQQVNVQKSVGYDLGTQTQVLYKQPKYTNTAPQQDLAQYYQPGTTLFTTLNQQGQVGGLSQHMPEETSNQQVIYLRIFSNQLTNPNDLYPNLPASHPYSNINSVNLQSLLTSYLQNNPQDYSNLQQQHTGIYNQVQDYQYEQPQQVVNPYQEDASAENLPTHENYPDDAHTRVIFHSNNNGHLPEKINTAKPLIVPSAASYTSHPTQPQHYTPYLNIGQQYTQTIQQTQDDQGYYYPNQPNSDAYYSQDYQVQDTQNYQGQDTQNYQGAVQNYQGQDNQNYQAGAQNYQAQDLGLYYQSSNFGDSKLSTPIDTQESKAPFNYHAHPRSKKRNAVRRPASATKIVEPQQE